jgi:anti-anti-sigma regulatory factor
VLILKYGGNTMINIKMEYSKKTLFIELSSTLNALTLKDLKRKVFIVIDEYDIKNIILDGKGLSIDDKQYINLFYNDYKSKYNGRLTIRV